MNLRSGVPPACRRSQSLLRPPRCLRADRSVKNASNKLALTDPDLWKGCLVSVATCPCPPKLALRPLLKVWVGDNDDDGDGDNDGHGDNYGDGDNGDAGDDDVTDLPPISPLP